VTVEPGTIDVWARILAVGGLLLGIINTAINIIQSRRSIKVFADNVVRIKDDHFREIQLSVTAVAGYRPMLIEGVTVEFNTGDYMSLGSVFMGDSDGHMSVLETSADSDSLPAPLADGDKAEYFFQYDQIAEFMLDLGENVSVVGIYAHDAEHKKHKAKLPRYLRDKINNLNSS
jgi:hypothetical protein